jgi:xanthine dehydrogenase YagS FAD-binding subunit
VGDKGIDIGALATLAEIAEHKTIREDYRVLAQACELSASPQIRNVATIGGNLCQDSRCPYYRSGFTCYLRGGETCFMRDGENREAAVVGYYDCVHAHPSDPANALLALDASIFVQGRGGTRIIPVSEFFRSPRGEDRRMNVLERDELITRIHLPRVSLNTRSIYEKGMDRAAWTFALASAAVRLTMDGERITDVRVVLGGVAPTPQREFRVEKTLHGQELSESLAMDAARAVLLDAQPLSKNKFKVRAARGLVKRALTELMT